ncbi:MAG: RnfABCDGE type electron transport complex subunit D [Bacillota bacterium]|nr:RnfABCDGE type electron transport complex subunit D [Bacillota bacterium]
MDNINVQNLTVSETPHIRSSHKTSSIMLEVFLALCPAAMAGIYFFGFRALIMIVVSIASSLLAETLYNKIAKKKNTISDCSALLTGILIAMNVSVVMPFWAVALSAAFAIIVVKQLFGGLGGNFMNPALCARAFLMASFLGKMTSFAQPMYSGLLAADAVTSATPLAIMKEGSTKGLSLLDMFIGKTGGCIGETSAVLLILGGIYLIARKIIKPHLPLTYIAVVAICSYFLGGFSVEYALMQILSGGLMLGAFFMATDYVTSPMTEKGMVIAGIICGLLTVAIRHYGGYPEGVSYAILMMNAATPLIDRLVKVKRFGEVSSWKKKEAVR